MTDYMQAPYEPKEITDLEVVFPATVQHLMPAMEDIPEEFMDHNIWVEFQQRWFFEGLPETVEFSPRDGIDPKQAFRHLRAVQGSYEPKHEYKQAAVAYLASLWFHYIEAGDVVYGEKIDSEPN